MSAPDGTPTNPTSPDTSDTPASPLPDLGRAVIIGAGSMGTLLAAVLGRVMPVMIVCQEADRAAQLFRHGAVATGEIEATSEPLIVRSLEHAVSAGGASLVFVATKTTAIPAVADELKRHLPSLNPSGAVHVISFQNGIDPGRELMRRLDHPHVLRMVLTLGAVMEPDGSAVGIRINSPPHAIGSVDPAHALICDQLAEALTRAGLGTRHEPDIEAAVWGKGLLNAAMNPVAALCNCTVGEVIDAPARIIFDKLIAEGLAVARAEGIDLPDDYTTLVDGLVHRARDHVPSMVEDIRQGRESEVGQLGRQIIEHGRRLGVPTPTHETVDALIETFDWKVYQRAAANGQA
ncbi:MAG: 2-dehydropantoate 2-reductase [Phycisphaerales bacterium]|jgi:2-dehydropantoate 2-reductase